MHVYLMVKKVHPDKYSLSFKIGGIKILLKSSFQFIQLHTISYYLTNQSGINISHKFYKTQMFVLFCLIQIRTLGNRQN